MASAEIPIEIGGRYFWRDGDRFIIRGVVYQTNSSDRSQQWVDPLADDRLEDLKRDLSLFVELGLNTIHVYRIDSTKCHDAVMRLLADAGIYVVLVLSSPFYSINRLDAVKSYNLDLLQHFFMKLDSMAKYANTLGVIVAAEVVNDVPSTPAAEIVKAVVRDVKRYVKLKSELTEQRVLPVGVSASDVLALRKPQFQYFCAGNTEESVDFFTLCNYSWVGNSSMEMSGYNNLIDLFSDTTVPVFFSEYGGKVWDHRTFQETKAIFSPRMTTVFSGGCAYELFMHSNKYGMVDIDEHGNLIKLTDFENYKQSLQDSQDAPNTDMQWASTALISNKSLEFPPTDRVWMARSIIPTSPVDWESIANEIEGEKWTIVPPESLGND